MAAIAGLPTSMDRARLHTLRKLLLFTTLSITTIVAVLCPRLYPLRQLGDNQIEVTRSQESTKLGGSRFSTGAWDQLNQEPLGWKIQNQTHRQGQIRQESDYKGWHPRRIESTEFTAVEAIQPGRLELVRHPEFGTTPVLVKIADAHEATMYRLLYDLGTTPVFLGHVTQNDEIVGFITEFVQRHGKAAVLHAASRKEACLSALRRMHARGIAHRDAHGENCLLREDGSAALIDFELSIETSSRAEFDRDLWIMDHTVPD